jgi:hypothetical protein
MKKETKKTYERPLIKPLNAGLMNKFGKRTEWSAFSQIDGVPILDLVKEYGSPLFVYSEKKFVKIIKQLNEPLKHVILRFNLLGRTKLVT